MSRESIKKPKDHSAQISWGSEKLVGVERPQYLDKLYFQWQEEYPEIETVIDWGVRYVPPSSEYLAWLKEGLRLTHFGIYLARLVFPKPCQKVAYPQVLVDETDKIAITVIERDRPVEIVLGYDAMLQKKNLFSDEGMAEIISTAVEEYSHWVRGYLMWTDPQDEAKLRQDFDIYNDARDEVDSVGTEIAVLNNISSWSEFLEECTAGQCIAYLNDLERRSLAAHIRKLATPDEFMGIIWQRKVCKLFFPWSEVAKRLQKEYDQAFEYKLKALARQR